MSKLANILGLALRLALAWYLGQLLLVLPFSPPMAFLGGLILFPWVALGAAALGTWIQVRAIRDASLSAFQHLNIQLPLEPATAEAEARAVLETLGPSGVEAQGSRLVARFAPPVWSGRLRTWTQTDELRLDLEAMGPGTTLRIEARPHSRLLYGLLWVDGGRNRARLASFQALLAERLAQAAARQVEATREATLEARLAQAELLLLRAQVDPHFLFNTLAHLRELIRTVDTGQALAMLDHLVAYTRAASTRALEATQPLGLELETVRDYLGLVRLRFGEALAFHVEADPALEPLRIPVGALLVPVENAIKHGLEPQRRRGHVGIRAQADGHALVLDVTDDGVGLQGPPRSGGGLANLRERLRLFHPEATLTLEDLETGGVSAQVRLPLPTA